MHDDVFGRAQPHVPALGPIVADAPAGEGLCGFETRGDLDRFVRLLELGLCGFGLPGFETRGDLDSRLLALPPRVGDGAGVALAAERLALVPRPRTNVVAYHGLFAANAKHRAKIVPAPKEPRAKGVRPRNYTWAELLRRGLDIDGLECPTRGCPGRLVFVATIDEPRVVRRILEHLGLPADPVRLVPARAPPFDFEAA